MTVILRGSSRQVVRFYVYDFRLSSLPQRRSSHYSAGKSRPEADKSRFWKSVEDIFVSLGFSHKRQTISCKNREQSIKNIHFTISIIIHHTILYLTSKLELKWVAVRVLQKGEALYRSHGSCRLLTQSWYFLAFWPSCTVQRFRPWNSPCPWEL